MTPSRLFQAIAGGIIGGVAAVIVTQILGVTGLMATLEIEFAPQSGLFLLFKQIGWSAFWGLAFLAPLMRHWSWPARGLAISLAPTLASWFIFVPRAMLPDGSTAGLLGLGAGAWTPFLILFVNVVWGLVAAWWFKDSPETAAQISTGKPRSEIE